MSVFRDSAGLEWRIFFDAFSLADVAKDTGTDLADISAGGWLKIETDSGLVGRVLAVLCRDEMAARNIPAKSFVRTIRGGIIDKAREALIEEGADFFPPSEWSAILSNSVKRKEARTQAETIQQAMEALDGMSPEFRMGAMQAIMEVARTSATDSTSSPPSPDNGSAAGPDVTPLHVVTSGLENAESLPED